MKKNRVLLQEPFIPPRVTYGRYSFRAGNTTFPYGAASIARYISDRDEDLVAEIKAAGYFNPVVWYLNLKEIFLFRQSPYKYWQDFKAFLSSLKE